MTKPIHLVFAALLLAGASANAHTAAPLHRDLYELVARHVSSPLAFHRVPVAEVGPQSTSVRLTGLDPSWGVVSLQPNSLRSGRHVTRWSGNTEAFGRQAPVRLSLELAEVWASPATGARPSFLCLQSGSGDSGSAARWQQVVVVQRRADGRLSNRIWTSAYASCAGIMAAANGDLIVPVLEFAFESERSARSAHIVLHNLATGQETRRYRLHMPDASDFSRLLVDLDHPLSEVTLR